MRGVAAGVMIGVLLVAGCSLRAAKAPDPSEIEANTLLEAFETRNKGLDSFKGIGTVKYQEKGILRKARVAWAGVMPDKLRMSAMAPSGHPLVSFSDDGVSLYVLSHVDNRFYQGKSNTALKKFLSVPVTTQDLIAILCGRIPVQSRSGRSFLHGKENGYVLEILNPRGDGGKRFFLDKEKKEILKIESVDSDGAIVYRGVWSGFKDVEGFLLPHFISFQDREAPVLELEAGQIWVNPAVNPDAFILKPGTE